MAEQSIKLPIQESLVNDTKSLAKELNISWSHLVSLALKDFIRRYRGRKQLVANINAAYADEPDADEVALQKHMRVSHRKIVEGEW